ncbi:MAG: hypothetical protein IJ381_01020 [Clostridia bacterium]|nr:hypothetical protein [Clostridia bacterium]
MRIIHLVRRYASLLSLLSVLGMLIAAPYLIAENPDSAIFRNGTFGLLLLLCCMHPLVQAFRRADLRTLLCSMAFGLLFCCALSLGAELRFYGRLLPGMGSMLRRLAVPMLGAPFLGGLSARLMLIRPQKSYKPLHLSMGVYMVILLACWLPLLIAHYPGMLNYDFHTEYQQFLAGQWDNRHPLLYIVINYTIFSIGRATGHPELSVFVVTLLRMILFAAALSYSCIFAQRRRVPAFISFLLTTLYALHPVFSVMSVSSAKDTLFAAALLVLSLLSWSALENPRIFFSDKRRMTAFVLSVIFTWHMRKNGVAAMLLLILLVIAVRGFRLQMAKLCMTGAALSLLLGICMNAVLHPVDQPTFQIYSLPAQQLARAYNLGEMTEEERSELRSWYIDSDWGLQLLPHLADAAKGSLDSDRLAAESDAFMDLWKRVGKKNVRVYTEAFLLLNIGSWYPDDTTHASIYQPYGLDKGYLQTDEYDLSEHGIGKYNPLPMVRLFYDRLCRRNIYLKYPVIAQLFAAATPLWCILFACFTLVARKQTRLAIAASGALALWLSYLFGPCTLARYMLPLFCLAPAMLIGAFSHSTTPERTLP